MRVTDQLLCRRCGGRHRWSHRTASPLPPSLQQQRQWVTLSFTTTTTLSSTTWVRRYQKGKTNLDFTGARDSEWQWHHLGHVQVCTSLQTDNHASTWPLCFLQAGCPSCHPTNSVEALKALYPSLRQSLKLYSKIKSLVWRLTDTQNVK